MSWGFSEAVWWNSLVVFCALEMLNEYSDFQSSVGRGDR